MTEAKLGLLMVATIIIVFAATLRKMGAISTAAAVAAAIASIAIASFLFLTQ